jgi:hypothetical protein
MEELVAEARDPNTKPERLVELLRQGSLDVREAVARNANTPLKTLLQLAEKQPQAVLKNPVLPLLLLENPNVLHQLEHQAVIAILRVKPLPAWVAQSLASHPDRRVRWDISGDEETPKSVLEHLAQDSDYGVRGYVAGNLNTPKTALAKLSTDTDVEVRKKVAAHNNTPVSVLKKLAMDEDKEVRRNVELNNSTPYYLQVQLEKESKREKKKA